MMFSTLGVCSVGGLTSEEDSRRVLAFEQSRSPGVKAQPKAHSQHCSTCQLNEKDTRTEGLNGEIQLLTVTFRITSRG